MNQLIYYVNYVIEEIEKDPFTYWPNFLPVPYALYDGKKVALVSHPSFNEELKIVDWTPEFSGNTMIPYEGVFIAIMDIRTSSSYEELYKHLIHEMFHCYQLAHFGELMVDDMLLNVYPLEEEHLHLLLIERLHLYNALKETSEIKKKESIDDFITTREKRFELYPIAGTYELDFEQFEGIATYIESKVSKNNEPYIKPLEDLEGLVDHFRANFFYPGVGMCLLLDELISDWKIEFIKDHMNLYEYFKKQFHVMPKDIILTHSPYVLDVIKRIHLKRMIDFKEFENQDGYKVCLKGEFSVAGYDPMNMTSLDEFILHKRFVRFKFDEKYFIIPGMVKVKKTNDLWKMMDLEFYVKEVPRQIDEQVVIESVGHLKGRLTKNNNEFLIVV